MTDTPARRTASVIVVAVEPGQPDDVLLQACALAADLGCHLVCVHVDLGRYPVEEHPDGSVVSLPYDPDLPELGDEEFDPTLADHIAEVLGRSGAPYTLRALAGDPARALGHLADAVNARLIVVGTHRPGVRRGVREFFNGSVAVHLAHRQHRPILVVPLSPVTDGTQLPWK
ncbi:universal stress protein [Cryobacterium tepidiphilum]|uniref:Universal stress protein n=1 Tax=Cryobacterium tepidiphilum TaxID=2486026 RepID=A0A3M8LAB6_9MICO|nr:universal stress protein [Cryobacterium tepidiphilum]RNE62386.1 universal stress protein [Cryobacterium tepidiphilum]